MDFTTTLINIRNYCLFSGEWGITRSRYRERNHQVVYFLLIYNQSRVNYQVAQTKRFLFNCVVKKGPVFNDIFNFALTLPF